MKEIGGFLEITTWKAIAYRIQQLNFMEGTEQEFQENLIKLNKMLKEIEIESFIGERNPKLRKEIGISSLLQSVQDINVPGNYKKATFYEKIYQLADLGVQEIKFCCEDSYQKMQDLVRATFEEEVILQKCYTDGTFQLRETEMENKYIYNLYNLCNANYVLITTLSQSLTAEERYSITCEDLQIKVSSFNGIFPSKKEIMKFEFPELVVAKQSLIWGETPRVKEKFETYDSEKGYQKCIKKDNNNEYYYEM